ncbi:hypothetical protein ACHAXA_002350 [Cyclostephanos tholiformis]|uniref:Peptidase M20 dimerisation domain-containing protein n=1 Tax=Cyclostephanos tholiformis TaxID=382380 RepID=A0ABD3SRQ9_9STRA
MYGRGAGDMKAGVVAMIYAIVALRDLGYVPAGGGLTICTVVEEECTGNGALASLPATLAVDVAMGEGTRTAVIIPEPFPWIVTAQLGVIWFTVSVTGRPCHVLSTSSGSNAIEGAYALYDSLRSLEDRYNEPRGNAHPAYVGIDHPVNFNLGRISGGNWASSVPSRCEFEVRVGFFPGVSIDDVKRDVETTMRGRAGELGLGLDIAYRGFHADGAVLLPGYVDGTIDVDDESGDDGSRSLQKDFVETIQRCNRLVSSSSSPSDVGDGAEEDVDGDNDGESRSGGDAILLIGHVDVVPASNDDGWSAHPFDPVVRDGRMYGRGAGDMKAGVVAMIYAIVALRDLGYVPAGGGLTICTVVEEECTGNGALASLPATLAVDVAMGEGTRTAVIIPEPFPWIVTAQLGVIWFTVSVTGRPCHVLSTSSGSNAIEGAYALYDSLRSLEDRYNEPRGNAHPAYVGIDHPVNFNLGRISGGNWASSVPSRCEFEVRVGFFPGVSIDDVKRDVETTMRGRAGELGLGLDIAYRGFHADGAVLLPGYVDGTIDVDDESGDDGSRSLQKDFVETIQRCNRLVSSSSSPSDVGDGAEEDVDGDNDGESRSGGDAILLIGHVDVVPASNDDGWSAHPFDPVVRDGRMYGRGAGDMKAGVVAMIYAIVALRDLGYVPAGGGLTICTVVEEECTGNGALASLPATLAVDVAMGEGTRTAVIIPEPFPWIVTAQLGVIWFTVSVTGRPCHVLSTSSGSNAIEGAYALYDSLRSLEDRYNEPRGNAHPAYVGIDHPVNFNLGRISGGNWASSVPSRCEFEVRVGFFPGVSIDDVKRDVETTMRGRAGELGLGLDIAYRGFHADGAVLLPGYVDGTIDVDDESGDDGSRSLQKDFVETIQRCNRLVSSSSSPSDVGDGASRAHPASVGIDHPVNFNLERILGGGLGEFRPEQVRVRGLDIACEGFHADGAVLLP